MLGTRASCAKTGEPIEMPFGMLTLVSQGNDVLDKDLDRTNPFAAARGEKSAMRPFVKLLGTLVIIIIIIIIIKIRVALSRKRCNLCCKRC